jgi:ribosomal protein L14
LHTGSNPVKSTFTIKTMIQPITNIKIKDNSGVKAIRCVHVESKNYRSFARVGNTVLGVVVEIKKKTLLKSPYTKGDLVRVFIASSRKETPIKHSGIFFKNLASNVGIVIQPSKKKQTTLLPAGSRFESYLPYFFRDSNFKTYRLYTNLVIL